MNGDLNTIGCPSRPYCMPDLKIIVNHYAFSPGLLPSDYDEIKTDSHPVTLANPTELTLAEYKTRFFEVIKPFENARLATGTAAGTSFARIHNDGLGLPTLGYGFNLANKAVTYELIENAYRYAINRSSGKLSDLEDSALGILKEWKTSGSTKYSNNDIINLSSDKPSSLWSKNQTNSMKSLELTDAQATRLLEFMTFKSIGNFPGAYDDALTSHLGSNSSLALSLERVGVLSAFYNAPGLIGADVKSAIVENNRAGVWASIRYNSNFKDENGTVLGGLIKRRVQETDLIGLSTRDSLPREDALQEAKLALDYLFTGTFGSGQSVYSRINQRDAQISSKAGSNNGFRAEIRHLLDRISNEYGLSKPLDRIDVDTSSGGVRLLGGAATDIKHTLANTSDGLFGEVGDDTIDGFGGDDLLVGGNGNDNLIGNTGHDILIGGEGTDTLSGGPGNDILTGGNGKDRFVFGPGRDIITDFSQSDEVLDFENVKTERYSLGPTYFTTSNHHFYPSYYITRQKGFEFLNLNALVVDSVPLELSARSVLKSGGSVGSFKPYPGFKYFILQSEHGHNTSLMSGFFASTHAEPHSVRVIGEANGRPVAEQSFVVEYAKPQKIEFSSDFKDLNRFTFVLDHGIVMDDLVIRRVGGGERDRIVLPAGATASQLIDSSTMDSQGNAILSWQGNSLTLLGVRKNELSTDFFV